MQQNLRARTRMSTALAALVVASLATSCAPPQTDDEAVSDILRVIAYEPHKGGEGEIGLNNGVIRTECKAQIWSGPRTGEWIAKQPILGGYASGKPSVAIDARHLTKDDLGLAIGRNLELRKTGIPTSQEGLPFSAVTFRTSQYYLSPSAAASSVELVKPPAMLRSIVATLGQPRYAYNQACDGVIVLLYGDVAYPARDSGLVAPPATSTHNSTSASLSEQCLNGGDFIQVSIFDGQYGITNRKGCARG